MLENRRTIGTIQESNAWSYLISKGWEILEKNYRIRQGEIDLIARDDGVIVFLEVKYRKNTLCGTPAEAVTYAKQRTIYRVAQHYLTTHGYAEDQPCRFDVIAIFGEEIRHYENAFGGM